MNNSQRIVVGGPIGCGKSTFTVSAYVQLVALGVPVGIHEIDVYSDTHDVIFGKKTAEQRHKRKKAWFRTTIAPRIEQFRSDESLLVLGDLPGKITNPSLPRMVEPANGAIIVAKDWNGLLNWQGFFDKMKIPVVARVISYQNGQLPLNLDESVFCVGDLNREIHHNGEVSRVVQRLTELVG